MPDGYVLSEADRRYVKDTLRKVLRQYTTKTAQLESMLLARAAVPSLGRVRFRNDNAGTVPAHGVLRITGMAVVRGKPILTIDQPDTSFLRLYLVNGPTQVGTGKTGWGYFLTGETPRKVLYDTGTPAYGESWGPKSSQWSLTKWRYGFTIMGGNDTTELTTHAVQHVVNGFLCKSNELITANGDTGAVSVYDGNQADITGTDVSGCINRTSIEWASDDWGKATWLGGNWYVEPWECPA